MDANGSSNELSYELTIVVIGHSRSRRMMGLFLTLPGTKGARFQVPRFVGYHMVSWMFQVWIAEDPLAY